MCPTDQVEASRLRPSLFPEVAHRRHLRQLLEVQIDMQMEDLRSLLAMPIPNLHLHGGCNLTAAMLLSNVIAGASMLLFEASLESVEGRQRDSGARFQDVLSRHYPWQPGDALEAADAAKLLYAGMRNPLTHNLGVGKNRIAFPGIPKGDSRAVILRKRPMDARAIERLLEQDSPPPRLSTITEMGDEWIVDIDMLTWGTYALLRSLLRDPWQVELADETARALIIGDSLTYVPPTDFVSAGECGPIANADAYDDAIELARTVVQVDARSRRAPPRAHSGTCGSPTRDKVLAHLHGVGPTNPRYYWATDIGVARRVFRARRCFSGSCAASQAVV